ncbi:MAG: hypothetical protein QOJ63_192 [Solirubrobacteraceae bacterium]|nr:hypothetical protein [Solirubrobacteraceae bacterium]
MSAFAVTALYDAHLPLGASRVDALVRIAASGVDEPDVLASLRLWTPVGATVAVLHERSPTTRDLRDAAIALDARTVEYPAGRWTEGAREYELAVGLPPRDAGDEMLAARVGVVVAGELVSAARIAVTWCDDERPTAASTGSASHAARPPVVTAEEELPTGMSPQPRHTLGDEPHAARPCAGCGVQPADGDRFCEGCGRDLVAGRAR